jgi:hypothetical protein
MNRLRDLRDVPVCGWPDDGSQVILEALRGSDEEDRRVALGLAGDVLVMDDEISEALLALISDPEVAPEDRGRACVALGPGLEMYSLESWDHTLGEPPLSHTRLEQMRGALRDTWADGALPDVVRRGALEASARVPEEWHQAAVSEAFSACDRGWRLTALRCAGFVAGFEMQLLDALDDGLDQEIRLRAVQAADRARSRIAGPDLLLLACTKETPRVLREAAVEALGRVDVPGRQRVLAYLVSQGDEELADIASFALAEMHDFADESTWGADAPPD